MYAFPVTLWTTGQEADETSGQRTGEEGQHLPLGLEKRPFPDGVGRTGGSGSVFGLFFFFFFFGCVCCSGA